VLLFNTLLSKTGNMVHRNGWTRLLRSTTPISLLNTSGGSISSPLSSIPVPPRLASLWRPRFMAPKYWRFISRRLAARRTFYIARFPRACAFDRTGSVGYFSPVRGRPVTGRRGLVSGSFRKARRIAAAAKRWQRSYRLRARAKGPKRPVVRSAPVRAMPRRRRG
jgi:hypothetical protein